MNAARKRAYRMLMSGYRYHCPNVSRLTIGYRRGTLRALREDFRELCRSIQRKTKCKPIEYFATWVQDTTEYGLRRHAHILWTSPIVRWTEIYPIFRNIVDDNATCWIDVMEGQSNYKIAYVLQYNAAQKGESVRFSMSKAWLPSGYDHAWREIWRRQGSDDSVMSAIDELNTWIDKQRGIRRDTTVQSALVAHTASQIETGMVERVAFTKRRLFG